MADGHNLVMPQDVVAYGLSLEGTTLGRPFGPQPLVLYAGNKKMYCYVGEDALPAFITLKCDPMEATLLCAAYAGISPGYHMNKRHWISVLLDGSVPPGEIKRLMHNAYQLVQKKKDKVMPIRPPSA